MTEEYKVLEAALGPHCLIYKRWLDFGTRQIEWDAWTPLFNKTIVNRNRRNAQVLPEEGAELLVVLLEAIASHVASSNSYVGGIELQIITHSMISYRFMSAVEGNWGNYFRDSIEEIIENVKTADDKRFIMILMEVQRRVVDMHSPIIDHHYLCYPIGQVIGINQPVDY
jgi:hypothetical protein